MTNASAKDFQAVVAAFDMIPLGTDFSVMMLQPGNTDDGSTPVASTWTPRRAPRVARKVS